MVGTPREIEFLANKLHGIYSKGFREWRDVEDVERDLLIGFWMGWFIWLAFPATLPQGVAATTMTGGIGYLFGPLLLFVHVLDCRSINAPYSLHCILGRAYLGEHSVHLALNHSHRP